MQELSQSQVIKPPSQFPWFASLVLIALTTLSIGGLYAYSFVQRTNIDNLQSDITKLDTQIAESSKDKKIAIANILSSNQIRPSVDLKRLVIGLREVATKNGVHLTGFAVQKDTISSQLTAMGGNGVDAVKSIIEMMRVKDIGSGLRLEPIYSVVGTTLQRTTNVSFRILPPNAQNHANQ